MGPFVLSQNEPKLSEIVNNDTYKPVGRAVFDLTNNINAAIERNQRTFAEAEERKQ